METWGQGEICSNFRINKQNNHSTWRPDGKEKLSVYLAVSLISYETSAFRCFQTQSDNHAHANGAVGCFIN